MSTTDAAGNSSRLTAEHVTHRPEARSLLRAELTQIAERFAAADCRVKRPTTIEDCEAPETERREGAGDFWAASADLADLLLLLFRYATAHQPDALRAHIVALLRPELDPIAEAVAKLESRL